MDSKPYSSDESEDYEMEKLISTRIKNGKREYLVKWVDFAEDENTWEREVDIDNRLIQEFKKSVDEKKPVLETEKSKSAAHGKDYGFGRNLEPLKVMGASCNTGELLFLMQWKGTDANEWVSSKEARQKCPQLLLDYYEQNIKWSVDANNHD